MKKIEPIIYKTRAWKFLQKEAKKMPKFLVTPINYKDKEERKKAKLMQKLINYQFKHNTNGIMTKYLFLQRELQRIWANEVFYGMKTNLSFWETMNKLVKKHKKI